MNRYKFDEFITVKRFDLNGRMINEINFGMEATRLVDSEINEKPFDLDTEQ